MLLVTLEGDVGQELHLSQARTIGPRSCNARKKKGTGAAKSGKCPIQTRLACTDVILGACTGTLRAGVKSAAERAGGDVKWITPPGGAGQAERNREVACYTWAKVD